MLLAYMLTLLNPICRWYNVAWRERIKSCLLCNTGPLVLGKFVSLLQKLLSVSSKIPNRCICVTVSTLSLNTGCPQTSYVAKDNLEHLILPLLTSQELRFPSCLAGPIPLTLRFYPLCPYWWPLSQTPCFFSPHCTCFHCNHPPFQTPAETPSPRTFRF